MTVVEQGRVFLAMTLIGAGLGALLQAMLLLCRAFRAGALLRGAVELCFGVCCAAAIITGALVMRVQVYRWYVFAGALIGMLIYGATVGVLVSSLWGKCSELSKKVGFRAKRGKTKQEKRRAGRI